MYNIIMGTFFWREETLVEGVVDGRQSDGRKSSLRNVINMCEQRGRSEGQERTLVRLVRQRR